MSERTPGPELDKLIAERVMGWPRECDAEVYDWYDIAEDKIPHYSTDITDAWEVVGRMIQRGWYVALAVSAMDCHCVYGRAEWATDNPYAARPLPDAKEPTTPHAICLAALQAVDKEGRSEG